MAGMLTHMRDTNQSSCDACPDCGGKRSMQVEAFGRTFTVPVMCPCMIEKRDQQEELDRKRDNQKRLESLRKHSLMDEAFFKTTFATAQIDKTQQNYYTIAKEYCDNWKEMKARNVGMTLIGSPGIGKTHIAFCIANELLNRCIPVIAISTINLINKVYESYGKFQEAGEVETIRTLQNADLLILDDLGAEHSGKTGKEKQIIYSVLDARLRNNKPLIITSNLTVDGLREKLRGSDGIERTFDRLIASSPIIEMNGTPRRVAIGDDKRKLLYGLANKK